MKYTKQEVLQFVEEMDVKFIRLAFCDVLGKQKNISITPGELKGAFEKGVAINASAVKGFSQESDDEILLHPDPDTLAILPWRPEHGRVVRMFCTLTHADGRQFENDSRSILIKAIEDAKKLGYSFKFGTDMAFYLFKLDENGEPTKIPYDNAGYMDIAPEDKGENVRREICLTIEKMDMVPMFSHHEKGPGQNQIIFKSADALTAADNALAYSAVVKIIASRNGLVADFSPKPLEDNPGNRMLISFVMKNENGETITDAALNGVAARIADMSLFLNPTEESYRRLENLDMQSFISLSNDKERVQIYSPDYAANPYLAFALIIYAALDGLRLLYCPKAVEKLPSSLDEAKRVAKASQFVKAHLTESMVESYCK